MGKTAFIGCGNMGGAIARAVCAVTESAEVYVANRSIGKAEALAADCGCRVCENNRAAAEGADYIFLGVKPHQILELLAEIEPVLSGREVIVSMAAGVTGESMKAALPKGNPVIRILPNTPCGIGAGLMLLAHCGEVSEEILAELEQLLRGCGMVARTDEEHADAGMTLGGCTPAFTYMFIEALADGGVKAGLKRADALLWAAKAVAGAAEMVIKSGEHPGALKDAVCSPGGATIEGVRTLETRAFRGAVIDAVDAAAKRSRELG